MQDSKSLDEISQSCGGRFDVVCVAVWLIPLVYVSEHKHLEISHFWNILTIVSIRCLRFFLRWFGGPGRGQRGPVRGPTGHHLLGSGARGDGPPGGGSDSLHLQES